MDLLKVNMNSRFPYAGHLTMDEIDYELKLRNYTEDLGKELNFKQRLLRRLFDEDENEKRDYRTSLSIDQEFELVAERVNTIRGCLAKEFDIRLLSRLKHYYLRVQRCTAGDEEAKKMKELLLGNIATLLSNQNTLQSKMPADSNNFESVEESESDQQASEQAKQTVD